MEQPQGTAKGTAKPSHLGIHVLKSDHLWTNQNKFIMDIFHLHISKTQSSGHKFACIFFIEIPKVSGKINF